MQLGRDNDKQRRWLAASSALFDAQGVVDNLIVIHRDAGVACWAVQIAHVVGPNGTWFMLEPVVVQFTLAETAPLLATGRADRAMFAPWAVHHQRGRDDRQVVREDVTRIEVATDVKLRDALVRAMVSMLGGPLLAVIWETMMDRLVMPDSAGFKILNREIAALGEMRVLFTLPGAQPPPVDAAARTHRAVRLSRCAELLDRARRDRGDRWGGVQIATLRGIDEHRACRLRWLLARPSTPGLQDATPKLGCLRLTLLKECTLASNLLAPRKLAYFALQAMPRLQ